MIRTRRALRRISLGMAAVMSAAATGCMNPHPRIGAHRPEPPVTVPERGAVPTELDPVNLPEYVIEPPDVLLIQARLRIPEEDKTPKKDAEKKKDDKDGERPRLLDTPRPLKDPKTGRTIFKDETRGLPIQQVDGQHQVRQDGTVFLGVFGSVPVSGLTLKQAAEAVRNALVPQLEKDSGGTDPEYLLVVMDVSEYRSKFFYVITDGGGNGEQVVQLPVTGKDTVLSAVSAIGGLSDVSSRRNIWVARRTPFANQTQQLLPVDWVGVSQWGQTTTNYQLFPGDRVYIKAQRSVTVTNTLARVLAPVEKLFGVTLLGANAVNNIAGRGSGFGNNGR